MNILEELRAKREDELLQWQRQERVNDLMLADRINRFERRWTRIAVFVASVALVVVGAQYFFPDQGPQLIDWLKSTLGTLLAR